MSALTNAPNRSRAGRTDAPASHSFTLILSAEPSDEQAERLYARCADATLGLRSGLPYAAFDRAMPSLPTAIETALRDVETTLPGIHVLRVEPDELVNAADIARRTGRSRASISQLIEGQRGPGSFPPPRTSIGGRPVWDWLDVARWFATLSGSQSAQASAATFLGALNNALAIRHLAPFVTDRAERRTLARLVSQDAELLGAPPQNHGSRASAHQVADSRAAYKKRG